MNELLPCPFCGTTKVDVVEGSTFRWRAAECGNCGARAGEVRIRTLGEGTRPEWEAAAREEAIREWNTRAVDEHLQQFMDHHAADFRSMATGERSVD